MKCAYVMLALVPALCMIAACSSQKNALLTPEAGSSHQAVALSKKQPQTNPLKKKVSALLEKRSRYLAAP